MDTTKYANSILKQLCDNSFFDEQGVIFKAPTERELIIKRLHWWMKNMERDIMNEAPMTCITISKEVMRLFDIAETKIEKLKT